MLTKILGGNKKITLKWASAREPDLAEYHIYRANNEGDTRNLLFMNLVHTEPVSPGDPATRPAEMVWIDGADVPLPGLVTFYYRIVASDNTGNLSKPSSLISAKTFDDTLPSPPLPAVIWIEIAGVLMARIEWSSTEDTLLQRCETERYDQWVSFTSVWNTAGDHTYYDDSADPHVPYDYRLWARGKIPALLPSEHKNI